MGVSVLVASYNCENYVEECLTKLQGCGDYCMR